MASSVKQSKNLEPEQLNKCSICPFKTHVQSIFQRHLLKFHGVKVTSVKVPEKGKGKAAKYVKYCGKCYQCFTSPHVYQSHKFACSRAVTYNCGKCNRVFGKQKNLNQHMHQCGEQPDFACLLCSFVCFKFAKMRTHYMDVHTLVCTAVKEPDFDQALRRAPYELQRPIVCKTLEEAKEKAVLSNNATTVPKNPKKVFQCEKCTREYRRMRDLNFHLKFNECTLYNE